MAGKVGNFIKVVGMLTVIGTVIAKVMPLLQQEHPKLKKKISHIGDLLTELKDEIADLATSAELRPRKK